MRITRPYGRTKTDTTDTEDRSRQLITADQDAENICKFTSEHPELLVAQWISILDKIATKPKKQRSPTKEQYEFRNKLGEALWGELKGLIRSDHHERIKKVWDSKVHPYSRKISTPKGKSVDSKGQWYLVFCGGQEPEKIDADEVAKKVRKHLHEKQLPIHPNSREKQKGLITSRAQSISKNVLQKGDDVAKNAILEATIEEYCSKGGDPVAAIHKKVMDEERCYPKDVLRISAKILHDQYGQVFGTDCSIQEAKEKSPVLFELHQDIKDTYRQLLKRSRKESATLKKILPNAINKLLDHSNRIQINKTQNDDIRLGKVIHYHLLKVNSGRNRDMYADIWSTRIDEIENSSYWLTEGQIEIKQTEAFIRIFRYAITFMAGSLRNISELDKGDQDILVKKGQEEALEKFNDENFKERVKLLFGSELANQYFSNVSNKDLFKHLIEKTTDLRNNIFHFKTHSGVMDVIGKLTPENCEIKNTFEQIWRDHRKQQRARVLKTLEGLKVTDYYSTKLIEKIIAQISDVEIGILPLPRFIRMITIAKNLDARFLKKKSIATN